MSLYKSYSTDSAKEQNGVPIEFEANDDGTIPTFIVSRMGETNKEWSKALRIATKPYQRQMQLGVLPAEKDASIFLEVFAGTIVKDWSNVQDENGNVIPFSKANAIKVFTDLPDLYSILQKQAADAALFRKDVLEAEAKN